MFYGDKLQTFTLSMVHGKSIRPYQLLGVLRCSRNQIQNVRLSDILLFTLKIIRGSYTDDERPKIIIVRLVKYDNRFAKFIAVPFH